MDIDKLNILFKLLVKQTPMNAKEYGVLVLCFPSVSDISNFIISSCRSFFLAQSSSVCYVMVYDLNLLACLIDAGFPFSM